MGALSAGIEDGDWRSVFAKDRGVQKDLWTENAQLVAGSCEAAEEGWPVEDEVGAVAAGADWAGSLAEGVAAGAA